MIRKKTLYVNYKIGDYVFAKTMDNKMHKIQIKGYLDGYITTSHFITNMMGPLPRAYIYHKKSIRYNHILAVKKGIKSIFELLKCYLTHPFIIVK